MIYKVRLHVQNSYDIRREILGTVLRAAQHVENYKQPSKLVKGVRFSYSRPY